MTLFLQRIGYQEYLQERLRAGHPFARYLDPDSSCQSEFIEWLDLSFEARLIRRNHYNRHPVSPSLVETYFRQPHDGHGFQIGHLP